MATTRRTLLLGLAGASTLGCGGRGLLHRLQEAKLGRPSGRGAAERFARVRWSGRVGGQDRTAWAVVPSAYDPLVAWPMVLVSHGHGQDGQVAIDRFGWGDACEARGFVGLFPDTGGDFTEGRPDNAFFDWLFDRAEGTWRIDPGRVYVGGFSGGCKRAYSYALGRSERIAAMAGHSGTIGHSGDGAEPWDPRARTVRPISVIHIHGLRDPVVPPKGGTLIPPDGVPRFTVSMREGLECWAEALGAQLEQRPQRPTALPSRCDLYRWRAPTGHLVEGVVDTELGHSWAPYATEAIIDFFERVPRSAGADAQPDLQGNETSAQSPSD